MGMSCGMSMVKYLLFVLNLLCALSGIAILAIGVAYYLQISDYDNLFKDWNVMAVPIVFIVLGSAIFIIAFFGCCGAIRESHCMTITYATFLMIILLIQVVIGILVFVNIGEIQKASRIVLNKLWDDREQNQNQKFWDVIQKNLQCCGLDGPTDWGIAVQPPSCCGNADVPCTVITSYNTGCNSALNDFVLSTGNIFGAVALGVAGVALIGFIFACCLANSIRNQSRRYA